MTSNLRCFIEDDANALRLTVVDVEGFADWLEENTERTKNWLAATGFEPRAGAVGLIPADDGNLDGVVAVVEDRRSPFEAARAASLAPDGSYRLDPASSVDHGTVALGWALETYRFERFKSEAGKPPPRLIVPEGSAPDVIALAEAVQLGRDMVNRPANDLGPEELADIVRELATVHGATVGVTVGEDLLAKNFPIIYAVGRASPRAPRLIDLRWGDDPALPLVTLVGKGVCFDTGGLDLKPSSAMLLMKKDMGGSACMAALAHAVMRIRLPVRLRLLIPAGENSVDGAAFRPGDVIATRKGLSVEIGNTDAEGRLVLADALALACEEDPDLLVDAATLTGAARVALGPDLPALFTPDDDLANGLLSAGSEVREPLWRLPLHKPYRADLDSPIADINNAGTSRFAGAVTAALFLQEFVTGHRWAHLDLFAHNPSPKPGRPKGGEVNGLLALFAYLKGRYSAERT
ncbi:MAG: M17 family metallopeptidase [Geminicoccaceae bacterium]